MTTTDDVPTAPARPRGERSLLDEVRAATRALRDPEVLEAELEHRTFMRELVPLLRDLDVLKAALDICTSEVERAILATGEVGSRPVVLEELGTLERVGGTLRKEWDDRRLLGVLVNKAREPEMRTNRETGEMFEEVDAVVFAIATCARLEWRTGGRAGTKGLRDYGLDPDQFCDKDRSPYRLKRTWTP